MDADGGRHLLVLLQAGDSDLQDTHSRGVGVVTRELVMPGHEAVRYLNVTCHDAAGHEAFDLIGGELAERLATGRETAPEVVARVLAKWRRFGGRFRSRCFREKRRSVCLRRFGFCRCGWHREREQARRSNAGVAHLAHVTILSGLANRSR